MTAEDKVAAIPYRPLAVVAEAWRLVLRQPGAFLCTAALPLTILLAITYATFVTGGSGLQIAIAGDRLLFRGEGIQIPAAALCSLAAYLLFAVQWQRAVLLGPAGARDILPPLYGYHLRYALWGLAVLILALLAALPVALLAGRIAPTSLLLAWAGVAVMAVVFARLQLVFPAIALGGRAGLLTAWRTGQGHGAALVGTTLLAALPFVPAFLLASFLGEVAMLRFVITGEPTLAAAVAFLAVYLIHVLCLALVVGAGAISFRILTGWQAPAAATISQRQE